MIAVDAIRRIFERGETADDTIARTETFLAADGWTLTNNEYHVWESPGATNPTNTKEYYPTGKLGRVSRGEAYEGRRYKAGDLIEIGPFDEAFKKPWAIKQQTPRTQS